MQVTFYFISGKSMTSNLTPESWEKILDGLREEPWKISTLRSHDFGLNFAHVTHYVVHPVTSCEV